MKAITFQGIGAVRCEAVREPELRAPGDAIVRVGVAGLCGSDLHVYRGHERGLDAGTVMGHELAGEVVEVGPGVERFRPGMRVVAPFSTSCGRCFYCARSLSARCVEGQLFGWVQEGRGLQGVQAEYARVPLADSSLVALPGDVSIEEGLFAGDVLATGMHCAESAGVASGDVVVVLGCGPVGSMAIAGARELGAARVFAIDSVPERLELAQRFGGEPLQLASAADLARVREASGGRGADAVLEAVGSPAATRLAYELLRPGGTISAAGVHTEEHFAFSPGEAYDKNLCYRAGRCPARSRMERALELVRSRRYPLADIVSHRLPLEEGARAYTLFDKKLESCTKVLFLP